MLRAIARGIRFLGQHQRSDGSWTPLWFGNEHYEGEENPIYGTAKVLMAFRDLHWQDADEARRGFDWLLAAQDLGGGWGGGGHQLRHGRRHRPSSIEETSLALEALLADPRLDTATLWLRLMNSSASPRPMPLVLPVMTTLDI